MNSKWPGESKTVIILSNGPLLHHFHNYHICTILLLLLYIGVNFIKTCNIGFSPPDMKVSPCSSVIEPYIKIDLHETQNTMVTAPKGQNDIFGSYAEICDLDPVSKFQLVGPDLSITAENIISALRCSHHRILRLLRINFNIWFDN